MGAPQVMLGTKCPSITSMWIRSAPALSTWRISSPSRVRSALRIEGAILMGELMAGEILSFRGLENPFFRRGVPPLLVARSEFALLTSTSAGKSGAREMLAAVFRVSSLRDIVLACSPAFRQLACQRSVGGGAAGERSE